MLDSSCDPEWGGYRVARGWRYTKLSLASALLRVVRVFRVCNMHPFLFYGFPARLAFYLSFLALCVFFRGFLFRFFLSFCFSAFMLSLELCRCSSRIFLSSRPRNGLATAYIYWVWLRSDRLT